ncbi:flagellar basal-body rod protein FlgG [Arcobacter aquimarinus]|uniref:Flagellar basal-body rod protein FlgG n=1 Tax=Arcobacter aquimarinus TaxID=1315211 RepID=A0AAE7E184_9BACT|nr:flagellar basal-body rod protein FlgG [Arcobacter aquimarinus]MCB9097123.1 flagellar basal-body rod protein FlgG [Arcobacter sp.]QKE26828.1 flagellar distal rod protein FlgF [Arcobacter aquimarinus]RXI32199.1 flagellar basal body rod protein FlgG [Arcobacter aquimarinus]
MIRGLYTAATGMNSMQHQIDVTSNNIANVNTTGFKQDRAEFQDLMYETLNYTAGRTTQISLNPTGIDVGLGVKISGIQKNFTEGDLKLTSNPYDLAIQGKGFFQITLPSGEIGYTRNGAFKLDSEGNIVNANGYLLEPAITIPEDAKDISIGKDGIVSVTNANGEIILEQQITIVDFINPPGLIPLGDSLFMQSDASGDPIEGNPNEDQFGSIQQGMIESSNVKLVNEMVDLITAQRAYEANSKAITTADSMLDIVNRLKN